MSVGTAEWEIDRKIGVASAVLWTIYSSVIVKKELSMKVKSLIYWSTYQPLRWLHLTRMPPGSFPDEFLSFFLPFFLNLYPSWRKLQGRNAGEIPYLSWLGYKLVTSQKSRFSH